MEETTSIFEMSELLTKYCSSKGLNWDLSQHLEEMSNYSPDEFHHLLQQYYLHPENENIVGLLKNRILDEESMTQHLIYIQEEGLIFWEKVMEEKSIAITMEDLACLSGLHSLGYVFFSQVESTAFAVVPQEVEKIYADIKGNAWREKQKRASYLYDYLSASVHLYGTILLTELVEIFNQQNEEKTNVTELKKVLDEFLAKTPSGVFWEDSVVAYEYLAQNALDQVKELRKEQEGKTRFLPRREEFLRYASVNYVRMIPEYRRLQEYFQEKAGNIPSGLMEELYFQFRFALELEETLETIDQYQLLPEKQEEADELLDLLILADHHTRKWKYKGNSQGDLLESF